MPISKPAFIYFSYYDKKDLILPNNLNVTAGRAKRLQKVSLDWRHDKIAKLEMISHSHLEQTFERRSFVKL